LLLSEEQRSTLQGWMRRRKTAQALSMRARIVLRASEGLTATAIAAEVQVCIQTVSKWWRRFDEQGLDGLLDEPRPGQPRKLSDRQIEQVIVRTLESKPPAATHWSTRMMAEASGINQTAIDTIEKNVPEDMDIHLILDNYGTHKTLMIRNWLAKRPRFHVHFTPTSASWLNLVQRWFALLTERQLRRGVHRSTKELKAAIDHYIENHNLAPRPFIWHKTADQILDSVARYCKRINDSGY